MSRSCPYRREISDACNWHQDQALNSTIYILYQTGPTGFLLKEDGEAKNFKVCYLKLKITKISHLYYLKYFRFSQEMLTIAPVLFLKKYLVLITSIYFFILFKFFFSDIVQEKDLCKHICWVLLKKFRVLRTDPRNYINNYNILRVLVLF